VLREKLTKLKPDVAICHHDVAYWKDLFLAVLAQIPARVGYVHKGFSGLVTHPVPIRYRAAASYFRDMVALITGSLPTGRCGRWCSLPRRMNAMPANGGQVGMKDGIPALACFPATASPQAAGCRSALPSA